MVAGEVGEGEGVADCCDDFFGRETELCGCADGDVVVCCCRGGGGEEDGGGKDGGFGEHFESLLEMIDWLKRLLFGLM